MKIYRCVKTNILTQGYGVKNTKPDLIALYNSLGYTAHPGNDFAVECVDRTVKHGGQCEQIYYDVDMEGKIMVIQKDEKHGYGITIRTESKEGIFDHFWGHFDYFYPSLKVGDMVDTGEILGTAGNTGASTGAHCHRELRKMARDTYGNVYKENPENGFKGAVPLEPFYENTFVVDVITGLKEQISLLKKIINIFKYILGK